MILEYYQEDVPSTDEAEKYYNSRLSKIEDLIFQDKDKKKKFLDPVLKMSFGVVIQIAENNKRNYDAVSKDVREIINEINREEKK